jgi:imidazolonepropionase-like amidohydrolase
MGALAPKLRELMERLGLDPDTMRVARAEQLRLALEHGVRVVSGTDAGIGGAKLHGDGVWRSVVELTDAGPFEHALATATSDAAEVLGLASVTGRLRPGLAADLLVVDGDVRADHDALGRPVAVYVRGVAVPPALPEPEPT